MTKLSDTQLVLLSTAAAHPDGHLFPLPATLSNHTPRIRAAIRALLKQKFIVEPQAVNANAIRQDEDMRFDVFITDAGRQAIGVELEIEAARPAAPMVSKPSSKIDQMLKFLRRQEGATLAELIQATGWLPHTTRAALTRLRQKGHDIDKTTRNGVTAYCIKTAA